MRAGSTLLKALLAESEEISHLPEVRFLENQLMAKLPLFSYAFYCFAYFSAPTRIVLLKKPMWLYDPGHSYPSAPKNLPLTVILLGRDPRDIAASLRTLPSLRVPANEQQINRHIYRAYCALVDIADCAPWKCITISYEELLQDPIKASEGLFRFLGTQDKGKREYHTSEKRWNWGSDDASSTIYSGVVDSTKLRSDFLSIDVLFDFAREAESLEDFLLRIDQTIAQNSARLR